MLKKKGHWSLPPHAEAANRLRDVLRNESSVWTHWDMWTDEEESVKVVENAEAEDVLEVLERHREANDARASDARASQERIRQIWSKSIPRSVDKLTLQRSRDADRRKLKALVKSAPSVVPGVYDDLAPWRRGSAPVMRENMLYPPATSSKAR